MSSVPTSIGYMTVTARGVNALASNINAEEMSGTITFTPDVGREPLVAIAEDPKVLVSIDQIVASFDATGALRPPADGKTLPITDEGNLLLVAPGQPDNLSVYGWTWTAFFRPGEGQYWRPFAIVFGGLPDETVDLAEQYLLNHPASGGEISSAATVIREGDPRLSDARVPVHHTHSMEDIEDYEPPNLSAYAKTIDIPREPSDIDAAPVSHVPATPQDFGAVGDGVADDTVALQAWLDSLPADGGRLRLPVGQYLTSGGLTFDVPGSIIGDGAGGYETGSGGARILTAATSGDVLTVTKPGTVIRGVAFESLVDQATPDTTVAIRATDFDFARVEQCVFVGFQDQLAVDIGYFYTVRHSTFLRPKRYGAYLRNIGVGQADHGDMLLDGCTFSRYGDLTDRGTAVRWESGGGLRIIGCKANAGTQPGYTSTRFWTNIVEVEISAGNTSVFAVAGSSMEGFFGSAIQIVGNAGHTFGKIAITGNEFLASGSAGAFVLVDGSAQRINNIAVSGNVGYGSGDGVSLNGVTGAVISGNQFSDLARQALRLKNCVGVRYVGNDPLGRITDEDALLSSAPGGIAEVARDPWSYRLGFEGLDGTPAIKGKVRLGNWCAAIMTITVRGNIPTVGAFLIRQARIVTMAQGANLAVIGATVGTDIAEGPAAAQVTLVWNIGAGSGSVRPTISHSGATLGFGEITVEVDGQMYTMDPTVTS